MWVVYDTCKLEELESKAGNKYEAYALRGIKKGYKGDPDVPYVKPLFENSTVTVIEKGIERPNQSIVGFIHAMCKPGDTLEMKFDRSCTPPELATIENKSNFKPEYTPLSSEQVAQMQAQQAMANVPAPAPMQQPTLNQMNNMQPQQQPMQQMQQQPMMQAQQQPMVQAQQQPPFDGGTQYIPQAQA